MRIQYASDLHLDYHRAGRHRFFEFLFPTAEILVLAGDIGPGMLSVYCELLTWASGLWKEVVFIPGNHEYYGNSIENIERNFREISKFHKNVHFLQKDELKIGNVLFLGCTLWSRIPDDLLTQSMVRAKMNDYSQIIGFDIQKARETFEDHYQWLKTRLKKYHQEKDEEDCVVVITHHAPSTVDTSAPQFEGSITNCAFATDLEELWNQTDAWIFGHTHWTVKRKEFDTWLLANPHGYGKENKKKYSRCEYLTLGKEYPRLQKSCD